MRALFSCSIGAVALAIPLMAAPEWRLTRSEHFEVYAQSSDERVRAILTWFEQLRAFFELQGGGSTANSAPVRVTVFASEQEYQPFRLRAASDAYYVGTSSQDYIVMGTDNPLKFGLAAHEYAHLVLRASGLKLPPWLAEGLSEFFATLRITQHAAELGGALPARIRTLQNRTWMPLVELLSISEEALSHQERAKADLFYAESWALTEMLMLSPKYAPSFQKILASPTLDVETVTRDLHKWVAQPLLPVIQLAEIDTPLVHVEVSAVPLSAVGSSGHAALRSDQDLHHASIGLRSPGSIGSTTAASPSRPCRSSLALVSMAARAGVGSRHRGGGSEFGPVTTITATTERS